MSSRIPFDRVNWTSSAFLALTLVGALVGAPLYLFHFGIDAFQVGLFLFYVLATGMSITLGYHRLFAHKAFRASRPVKLFTLVFGACAFEDSALDWASDHRAHHKHVDDEHDDPYSISKGFFWAHMGWILFKLYPRPLANVADLKKDPLVMWQHRYHRLIALVAGLMLPAALGFLYSGGAGALGALVLAGLTRVVVVHHSTFLINSFCHTIGTRPYDGSTSARDSWLMALFTFGEGYHNFHHAFQHDYRNGAKPWQWDPTKWAIWLLGKLGLASDLRKVEQERIVMAELRELRRRAEVQLASTREWRDGTCPDRIAARRKLAEISALLGEGYRELESAVAERIRLSSDALDRWKREGLRANALLARLQNLEAAAA